MEESYPVCSYPISAVSQGYNLLHSPGATTDAHRRGEAVLAKARNITGLGTEGTKHGNQRMRFPGRPGSGVYLLEVVVNGPGSSEGMGSLRIPLQSLMDP